MSLIFQRSLPTPLSSQQCPPTSQINTQFGFFHSSPSLNQSPNPPNTDSSSPPLTDSCLDQLNWLFELDVRMKEFIGRIYLDKRMQQRQYGCRMNHSHKHHHRQENEQENTRNRHQAAAVHQKQDPALLARHDRNSSSSPSLSSSSCFPLLSLESPPMPR